MLSELELKKQRVKTKYYELQWQEAIKNHDKPEARRYGTLWLAEDAILNKLEDQYMRGE